MLFRSFLILSLLFGSALLGTARYVILTPPKCGTMLIRAACEAITEESVLGRTVMPGWTAEKKLECARRASEQGGAVVSHNWGPEVLKELVQEGFKVVFIERDPRDQLCSLANWIHEGSIPHHPLCFMKDKNELIEELITGERFDRRAIVNIEGRRRVLNQLPAHMTFTARFERLVGEGGGGSKQEQVNELLELARFLEVDLTPERAEVIGERIFGSGKTFRKGVIGAWRDRFTERHKMLYAELYGDLLVEQGYELANGEGV